MTEPTEPIRALLNTLRNSARTGKPDAKPFFPLSHEYADSLRTYTDAAGLLASIVGSALDAGAVDPSFAPQLRECLYEFNEARYGHCGR